MIIHGQTPTQRIAQLENLLAQAQAKIDDQRIEINALTEELTEYQRLADSWQERLQAIIAKMETR